MSPFHHRSRFFYFLFFPIFSVFSSLACSAAADLRLTSSNLQCQCRFCVGEAAAAWSNFSASCPRVGKSAFTSIVTDESRRSSRSHAGPGKILFFWGGWLPITGRLHFRRTKKWHIEIGAIALSATISQRMTLMNCLVECPPTGGRTSGTPSYSRFRRSLLLQHTAPAGPSQLIPWPAPNVISALLLHTRKRVIVPLFFV